MAESSGRTASLSHAQGTLMPKRTQRKGIKASTEKLEASLDDLFYLDDFQ
jgi:hypothetical protein